jgi:hypothetical protein
MACGATGARRDPRQRRHGRRWSAWFDGLDVSGDEHGQTAIAGPVVDQAAGTACWPGFAT